MRQFLTSLRPRKPKEEALLQLRIVMSTNEYWPVHLIFMLCTPESESPTWYQVVGDIAPSIYRPEIESALSFRDPQFIHHTICTIQASDEKQVRKTAVAVPPQRCRDYLIALLETLEDKGVVPVGTAATHFPRAPLGSLLEMAG